MAKVTTKKRRRSSSETPPSTTSFSSLPDDVVRNILARVSRIHYPTLSLVSKSLRSLVSSRELYVTRTLTGKTENYHYLCLKHPSNNHKSWFVVSPITQQKWIAIPAFPFEHHPDDPSVISTGSEIYIIGGHVNWKRSRKVFLLDCTSHQWRRLPNMRFPRLNSTASLIQGKIYVFGGCHTPCNENWGEFYDPKTESWKPLSPTIVVPDLKFRKRMVGHYGCFVGEEKIWCRTRGHHFLEWCDFEDNLRWRKVKGLWGIKTFSGARSMVNSDGGRGVTVWWFYGKCQYIRCAEISLERRSRKELFGTLEWSNKIYTMSPNTLGSLTCFATVTH